MNLDYIIVDEVSMVQEIFFKVFTTLKKIKPTLKFIFSGDARQLEPVRPRVKFEYKDSLVFNELCDGTRLQLENVVDQMMNYLT